MEVFSLEDDECSQLFITQTSKENDEGKLGNSGIILDPMDFSSPCVSVVNKELMQYSDISDDDFDMIPCSQKYQNMNEGNGK